MYIKFEEHCKVGIISRLKCIREQERWREKEIYGEREREKTCVYEIAGQREREREAFLHRWIITYIMLPNDLLVHFLHLTT